jgi:hypothetical protein
MKLLISAGKDPARVEEYFKPELEILRKHGYEYIVKEGGLDVALMSSKASISGFKHVQKELLNMVRGLCRCRAGWGPEKLHEGALLLAYNGGGVEVWVGDRLLSSDPCEAGLIYNMKTIHAVARCVDGVAAVFKPSRGPVEVLSWDEDAGRRAVEVFGKNGIETKPPQVITDLEKVIDEWYGYLGRPNPANLPVLRIRVEVITK